MHQDVVMVPLLREGEPRWEGRVLWALWLCDSCAGGDSEPTEARNARMEAERAFTRVAIATKRARRQYAEIARR